MWSADSAAVEPCTTRASRGLHPEACQGLHLLARRRLQPLQVVTAFRSCVCRRAWDRPARCAGGFHRAPQSGLQISKTVEKRCQNVLSPILFGPPVRSRSHRRTHSIFQTSTITAFKMCFHSLALNSVFRRRRRATPDFVLTTAVADRPTYQSCTYSNARGISGTVATKARVRGPI